jgi:hypothetical protein
MLAGCAQRLHEAIAARQLCGSSSCVDGAVRCADCRAGPGMRGSTVMRCAAGAGLLLLVGCNQIFGITSTQPWDAPVDVIADMPHVALTWQLAATAPSGAPEPTLEYPPFAPAMAPVIRIARLDGELQAADYSSDPATPGWIQIPRDYITKDDSGRSPTWRLEYTIPGGVPHEVQWAPEDKIAHLTVPIVGRLDRPTVPTGGGYGVTPSNFPGPYTGPRLLTTGLWTEGLVNVPGTGVTVDYDFSNAISLSGAKGRPDPAQGDRALLVDYFNDSSGTNHTDCRWAAGSAALTAVAIQPGNLTQQTVTWDAARKPVTSDPVAMAFVLRLTASLGNLHGTFQGPPVSELSTLLLGAAPSTDFPGLIRTSSDFSLPVPVMQTLLQCPYNVSLLPDTAQPALLGVFPLVLHVQLVDTRQALGLTLVSGQETVLAASTGGGFKVAFPAPMPTQIKLATPAQGVLDLSGTADQLAAGAPTGAFTLTFTPEAGSDLRVDYYDVTLHRIVAGELTSERVYTVTAPSVRIDGTVLVSGADYVFEIRSYKGHVRAPLGDFAPVDYPYGSAIVFTRTFKTS